MVRKIFPVFLALFFAACSSGMYDLLIRTTDDPKTACPRAVSFAESNAVLLSWDYDEGADEYILERASDSETPVFFTVYKGTGTEYADRGLENDTRYIYRLSKRRGNRIFGPSKETLGVSSLVSRDIYRNDTMEEAVRLETIDYIANIYYYRSYGGAELIDEDWYYVEIPPLRRAAVVVNDSLITDGNKPTHFMRYEYSRDDKPVIQLSAFWIINNELETKRYYFKLYPAKMMFVGMAGIPGGDIVRYTISIGNFEPI